MGWRLSLIAKAFAILTCFIGIILSGQDSNETNASQVQALLLQQPSVWVNQGSVFIKENNQSYRRASQGINKLDNESYFLSMRESLASWLYPGFFYSGTR